jgi:hypothetical protein
MTPEYEPPASEREATSVGEPETVRVAEPTTAPNEGRTNSPIPNSIDEPPVLIELTATHVIARINPLPPVSQRDLEYNPNTIRRALLEGATGAQLAREALRTVAEAATLPTFYECPKCHHQVEHTPRTVSQTQLRAAQYLVDQIVGKAIDRHQRVLLNEEYAAITAQAIAKHVPNITRQQLEKVAKEILKQLGTTTQES